MSAEKTILIVEDEILVAKSLERRLQSFGFETLISPSGVKALKEVEKKPPDLILMDIKLEGELDGVETAKAVSKKHTIPTIFLTAFSDEELKKRIAACNPAGYITKPFSETALLDLIISILKKD